jgi:hypothetical protein
MPRRLAGVTSQQRVRSKCRTKSPLFRHGRQGARVDFVEAFCARTKELRESIEPKPMQVAETFIRR